jgi:hypothetical protein
MFQLAKLIARPGQAMSRVQGHPDFFTPEINNDAITFAFLIYPNQ